ncbi:NAD(P)/FAD-dependent oxidoreductase [Hyphomicrobium sp.]|uniref:NAD(P)/FAD-dependent oxidoreductase n=1 Tax=Hyphomicrobium sp. TaxID=82 RepID=UPI002E34BAD2|nr:NAD(P)/FAD-dependent oxidoreductase [Hyphomicrobium sp.]HEX2843166.1 NAD(P)/FAD-dependent oxidoreductase [Hyphomicrobium sp.]
MHDIDRRQLTAGLASVSVGLMMGPRYARSAARGRVVVIGGGPAGATVAVSLKRAVPDLSVTLIEPQRIYSSCFYSNHFIGGFLPFSRITNTYDGLLALGITVIHERASAIDAAKREVRVENAPNVPYDRLVVAPGIGFKFSSIEGYSEDAAYQMPHAWSGGRQSRLLRERLDDMANGGLVVIAAPRNPYRCPPGPYERACLIANYLKREKPKSKLIILDPKMSFSKQPVFEEAFAKYYKDVIELRLTNDIDDMSVVRVDPKTGEVVTKSGETFKAAVANIIPDQTAGAIALGSGLAEGDWCPIKPENFQSAKIDNVYVVGDATIAAEMPKSAFSANSQARVVAGNILADLTGAERPQAAYRNTCWSMLAPDDSVKIGADYSPGDAKGKHALVPKNSFVSQPHEAAALRRENYEESLAWYRTLTDDIFAKSASATGKLPHGQRG